MIRVYSFDVFDTCLTRKVTAPYAVFYAVARKIFSRLNIVPSISLTEDFVAARIKAENEARQRANRDDITLYEIWRTLISSMGWQYDESLIRCELDAEEELITPVSSMRENVQAARRQKGRIVFLTDMYLPSEFIRRRLCEHGFATPADGLYVSGELGKTKFSGNLFLHLLATENVSPSKVLHTGDNRHSDYDVPRKLGLRARLLAPGRMTRTESALLQDSNDSIPAIRIAGAMRAFRLENATAKEKSVELASQLIAPFCMGLAVWALQRARENGVKRLYFLSRDCQSVWKVARELAPQFGGIDCRYLYTSRQALFLPAAEAPSPEEMPWMRRDFEAPVLARLLAKIDQRYEDVASAFDSLAGSERERYLLKSDTDWDYFWTALKKDLFKTRLDSLIATRREAARLYFDSAGLFDDVSWALVDFGWRLGCQESLWKLLKIWGWSGKIQGYYFGLNTQRVEASKAGGSEALIYETPPGIPTDIGGPTIFSHILLIESIVGLADHPTVNHYEATDGGDVGPVFGGSSDAFSVSFCRDIQREVLNFVRQNRLLVEDFATTAVCRRVLNTLVRIFFEFPTEDLANSVAKLSGALDQNGLVPLAIVKPLDLATALRVVRKRRCLWPAGAMAITPHPVRRISEAVARVARLRWKMHRALVSGMRTSFR